jgi:hypothetical protein
MEEIQKLYNQHLNNSFPDLRGEEINGIDLVLIDSDSAGLVQKFFANKGRLNEEEIRTLTHCYNDLKVVVRELEAKSRLYFSNLLNIVGQVIELGNSRSTHGFKPEWEKKFQVIRQILNEWDPIGVADSVDDEYDTMNNRTLSVIMNNRPKDEVFNILRDYTKHAMELNVDEQTLNEVTDKIWELKN